MPISEAFVVSPTQVSREELAEHTQNRLIEAETAGPAERQQIVDEVVTSHVWLAETLARRFSHRGEDEEDLLQVACTGLVEACRRFDPHQGSFVGFAVPTITGVLKRHFRDHGWVVRPPRPTQELASTIWRRWPTLVQQMGAVPGPRDLADELGEPVRAVQQARFASQGYSASSIDAAMSRGICFCSNETDEDIDRTEARLIIDEALAKLDEHISDLKELQIRGGDRHQPNAGLTVVVATAAEDAHDHRRTGKLARCVVDPAAC